MIVINSPEITAQDEFTVISSLIEIDGKEERLWYKFPQKFQQFLVTENLDAFLVGILVLGLKTGNNIKLESPVSARLYYTLNHYLIPALCLANPKFQKINIFAEVLNESDLNFGKLAGTGLSCGVDSFATYYDHLTEKGSYRIQFFTFLNAGSHGDLGGENPRMVYQKKLLQIKKFGKEENLEVISIDTNLSEILNINFQSTHTLRNFSCILNLQKLFKNYYYASPNRFDEFSLNSIDSGDYDLLNVSMLSTESINFFSSAANLTRTERTNLITNYSQTYKYLDVCTNSSIQNNWGNCSECEKCLRTELTLELLGKLHLYDKVFNIKKYYKNKNRFIGKVLATKEENVFNKDLWNLLKEKNQIHFIHYIECISFKFKSHKKEFKKFIKKKSKRC
ncbi:hypothetical protein BC962_2819 [Gillisia mitskevichiae]|uniref:7-cyano-7-deazaguanine synthase in queuosine biosynthesis n=1 Tax=Gillisia mitskevichiae TaxID=270921 RepID=A0A495P3Q6_9FLAO|nr:hypothetical protein [Gillisia mitskevichiae]RKS45143.1 hypothetical protein BC962_2819 [Gillisia mitskevichiae]